MKKRIFMKKLFMFLLIITSFKIMAMATDVIYLGRNCERVARNGMLTRPTNRIYFNGLLINEDKKRIERPIRDAWRHLNNPWRHRNTKFHFEDNYLAGSGKFDGDYVQFYSQPGVVHDPEKWGHAFQEIIAIGLENQDDRHSAYLEIPGQYSEIELKPERSCLYYFKAPNTRKTVFKVRSKAFYGYLYQKLYYNNNVDGLFLRNNYLSPDFENKSNIILNVDNFHKFYPNLDMINWIEP